MSTDDVLDMPCPWCGSNNDRHSAIGYPGAKPENLDVSLCMRCGQWALYCVHDDGEVHLRKPPGGVGYAHIVSVMADSHAS